MMSLLVAWLVGIASVILGLGIMGAAVDWLLDSSFFVFMGSFLLAFGVMIGGIVWASSSYSAQQHKGQVCVHEQPYTAYVMSGKVLVPVTGTECTAWAKDPRTNGDK